MEMCVAWDWVCGSQGELKGGGGGADTQYRFSLSVPFSCRQGPIRIHIAANL